MGKDKRASQSSTAKDIAPPADSLQKLTEKVESLDKSLFRASAIGAAITAGFIIFGIKTYNEMPDTVFNAVKSKVDTRVDTYITGNEVGRKVSGLLEDQLSQTIQLGSVSSDTDGTTPDTKWRPWRQAVGEGTVYVGLMRRVNFEREFKATPHIETALRLVNLAIGDVMSRRIDFQTSDARIRDRMSELHALARIDTYAFNSEAPDSRGFTLKLGIGLPTAAADKLVNNLRSHDPPKETRKHYLGNKGIAETAKLSDDVTYSLNWHWEVGTLDAIWIAKGVPK